MNYSNIAGALLFIAGLQSIVTVISAETLFPGYTTRNNDLSYLASTIPPKTLPVQPSATMFNITVILLGILVLFSTYLIHQVFEKQIFTILFTIFGAAGIAVGLFPGDTGNLHGIVALIWFIAGPLSAIIAYKIKSKPFAYISVIIGFFALMDLALSMIMHISFPFYIFGRSGTERMAAYPLLIWLIGFGGYLRGYSKIEIK